MKITDAVLILLSEKDQTPSQMAMAINSDSRFAQLKRRWGRVEKNQVYAAMSSLRTATRGGPFIEPPNGTPGIAFAYRLTAAGRARMGPDKLQVARAEAYNSQPEQHGIKIKPTAAEERVDMVNRPPHYTGHPSGVECITITEHMGFNLGNALKYIWRADLKGSAIEDLEKARWYLDREIAKREKEQR